MFLDIEVYKGDDDVFIASCPELNLYSRANTSDEAVDKLKFDILDYIRNSKIYADTKQDIEFSVCFYSSRYPQIH